MELQDNSPLVTAPAPLKLSWREKYVGILVLLMGLVYLGWMITDFLSTTNTGYARNAGTLQISISELMNHVRGGIVILLCIIGSILLFSMKRAGWVIAMALLLLLSIICGGILAMGFTVADVATRTIYISGLSLLLLAVLFLLLPSARKKYKVGKFTFLPTLILLAALAALFFLLQ